MRDILIAAATLAALSGLAPAAQAQVVDRYGSQGTYAPPPVAPGSTATRVLTWAGKSAPQAPQAAQAQYPQAQYPQAQYGQPQYAPPQPAPQRQPASYPSIQGAYRQPPAGYAPQPYPAQPYPPQAYPAQPQPGAPQPLARPAQPQGQPVTVAPQAFYPPQVMFYPQAYQGLDGRPANFAPPAPPVQTQFQPAPAQPAPSQPAPAQALPSSIYDPPRPAAAAETARTVQLAAMDAPTARSAPGQGARTYSVHRPFGRTPDPVAAPPAGFDTAALLLPAEDSPDALKGEGQGLRSFADVED